MIRKYSAVVAVALLALPAAADDLKSSVEGTLTVRMQPPAPEPSNRFDTCRLDWNKKLRRLWTVQARERDGVAGQAPSSLACGVTRRTFRDYMWNCLNGKPGGLPSCLANASDGRTAPAPK